jgi:hypothetical protein
MVGPTNAAVRQELEAGVSMTTTVGIEELKRLRDDCDKALLALEAPSPTH